MSEIRSSFNALDDARLEIVGWINNQRNRSISPKDLRIFITQDMKSPARLVVTPRDMIEGLVANRILVYDSEKDTLTCPQPKSPTVCSS